MEDFAVALIAIATLLVGGFLGFYITRKFMQKQMKENPPIDENMIRAMYSQMGRKPTETQIKQIMGKVSSSSKKK